MIRRLSPGADEVRVLPTRLAIGQIVALAKGDGMPASVIDRVRPRRPRFGAYTPTLRALAELGFYLRRANDEDGATRARWRGKRQGVENSQTLAITSKSMAN